MDARTAHALIRFGFGRRGSQPVPADPEAWLRQQLDGPDPLLGQPGPSTANALAVAARYAAIRRETIRKEGREGSMAAAAPPHFMADLLTKERNDLLLNLLTTERPFRERLVLFWTNHFTVSLRAGHQLVALLGSYVQEAIRPHVTGNFADMLRAVEHHPAMLFYLNNAVSVGPESPWGRRMNRGLNENLARECLELHTVGVDGGYTQADVTSFARVLSGWTVDVEGPAPGFVFKPDWHEPGPKMVMGRTFPEGQAGGEAVLSFLATHPATYRRIASQLVQHFVADDPPIEDVQRIAGVLAATNGDLKAASLEVTRLPGAWRPLTKLRDPVDYVVAVYRALDLVTDPVGPLREINGLGQPLLSAPLPNGWPDTAQDWVGGDAVVRRAELAWRVAEQADAVDPAGLADQTLGDLLGQSTRAQIAAPGSRREAVALLLASPEFMRR